jgi:drug/metabolite transporter, DME family
MTYARGAAMVVAGAVLWSLMGLALRHLTVADTWQVLFWRSAGMVPVIALVVAVRSPAGVLAGVRVAGLSGALGGICLVAAFSGAIFALQTTTVANAVFLFSAAPVLAALLAWVLLGESVRPATLAAIALAAVGMFVMVREGLEAKALAGNLAALFSALGFAMFTVILRWRRLTDMLPAVLAGGVMSMLVAGVILALTGGTLALPLWDIVLCLAMGAVLLGVGLGLYTVGSRVIPAAELALLSMAEVLLSPVWVWLFLGETASTATFLGGSIMMAAVALNAVSGARSRRLARTGT